MDLFQRILFCFIFFGGLVSAGGPTRGGDHERSWVVSFEGAGVLFKDGSPALACGEKITANISLPMGMGDHLLKILWVRPDGAVEQETAVKVKLSEKSRGNAVVWLLLNPERDNILSDFSLGDIGRKPVSYNGKWAVKIFFDSNFIRHEPFFVSCKN